MIATFLKLTQVNPLTLLSNVTAGIFWLDWPVHFLKELTSLNHDLIVSILSMFWAAITVKFRRMLFYLFWCDVILIHDTLNIALLLLLIITQKYNYVVYVRDFVIFVCALFAELVSVFNWSHWLKLLLLLSLQVIITCHVLIDSRLCSLHYFNCKTILL